MSVIVTVVYPQTEGSTFDADYYPKHLDLCVKHWGSGLKRAEGIKGLPGPDGSKPPYHMIAILEFESQEAMGAAMGGPGTAEIMGDVANYTNVQPVTLIGVPSGGGK